MVIEGIIYSEYCFLNPLICCRWSSLVFQTHPFFCSPDSPSLSSRRGCLRNCPSTATDTPSRYLSPSSWVRSPTAPTLPTTPMSQLHRYQLSLRKRRDFPSSLWSWSWPNFIRWQVLGRFTFGSMSSDLCKVLQMCRTLHEVQIFRNWLNLLHAFVKTVEKIWYKSKCFVWD